MGDSIAAQSDNGRITILCRDQSKLLQDIYLEGTWDAEKGQFVPKQYGSPEGVPAETVCQQMLDDYLGPGVITLYCPISPGFMVTDFAPGEMSLWDALQSIATQIGWYLGFKWWPDINDFRMTLMPVPWYKTAAQYDYMFDLDDIRVQELDITDRDVRNVVQVAFSDRDNGGKRTMIAAQDEDSIAEYGRKAMQISEAETSLIDTVAEAQALANAALWDLKDLSATSRITMPLMPLLDVFSGIVVTNPRLSSTQDFYCVETVEHVLDWSDKNRFRGSTEVVCSGRVIGAHGKWLRMQTRPGASPPVQTGQIAPGAVDSERIAHGAVTAGYSTSKTETQAITTTSTSYVEISDLTMVIDVAEPCKALVLFRSNVNCNTSGYSTDAQLQIDEVNYYESRFTSSTGFTTGNLTNLQLIELAAGRHTFKVFWKTTSGTSTMHTRQLVLLVLRR